MSHTSCIYYSHYFNLLPFIYIQSVAAAASNQLLITLPRICNSYQLDFQNRSRANHTEWQSSTLRTSSCSSLAPVADSARRKYLAVVGIDPATATVC